MRNENTLTKLSDDELLRRLSALLQGSRRIEAELIAHIAEVDARRLYAREAASSMFIYCTEVLHLSEPEAYLRIAVARACRKHPLLLSMLADGLIHLSGIERLAPHLTPANRGQLLKRAAHRSKRGIEELVAEVAPRPDVPSGMRKLPAPQLRPAPVVGAGQAQSAVGKTGDELRPDGVTERAVPTLTRPAEVKPLSPERYRVQFTASAELRGKLTRLQALMRSSVPDGDLGAIIEQAVSEKLDRLEAKRFGKTKSPRKTLAQAHTSSTSSRYIPAPIRRTVYERDGGRCTFVDERGRRCRARERLEYHHEDPYGRGGGNGHDNIRLLCRPHNVLLAERDYGKKRMNQFRTREPATGTAVERGVALLPSP